MRARVEYVKRLQRRGLQVERLADRHAQHPLFGDAGFAAAPDNRAGAALDLLATRRAAGLPLWPFEAADGGHKRSHVPCVHRDIVLVEGLIAQMREGSD